jgi:predicted amidohydrolase
MAVWLCCLLVSSGRAQEADVVYSGGEILTMRGETPEYVEFLAVKGGRILFAGARRHGATHIGPGTRQVDLAGRTLLPGFIDGHSHILTQADSYLQAPLAAWLVAKLEQAGPSGLPEIQQRYLLDPQRTESERLAAFLAISIHGNANPEVFREPAVAIYQTAIEAGQVNVVMIDDLTRWSRHEFRAALQKHLEKRDTDNPLRNALRAYLFGTDD